MNIERCTSAAFTGHRTYDGSRDEELRASVRRLYARGIRTFLTGMAQGFDLAAGECVVSLREEMPDLRLVCAVPFAGHGRGMTDAVRARYDALLAAADEVLTLLPSYNVRAYHVRNDFLVDHASYVVAYFDGSKGGTHYTVRRALRSGLTVENLYRYSVVRPSSEEDNAMLF